MKLFVRTSAFFAAVLIATGTIAGVGQANAQTNPLESQISAILDANPEIVVNALNKHQAIQQRMTSEERRGGKASVSTCRSRWVTDDEKNNKRTTEKIGNY